MCHNDCRRVNARIPVCATAGMPLSFIMGENMKKAALAVLAIASLFMSVLVTSASPATAQGEESTITILHNNDGESHLLPNEEDGYPGVARFVTVLKELQAESDATLTLTSGDNFLASKEFSAAKNNGVPYYDAIALSGLYDAMALGNHDFDFGPDITAAFISSFDPPVPFLSANADFSGEKGLSELESKGLIARSTVVETAAGPVGVIGAITPRLPNISSPRNVVISPDVVEAINAEAAALEAEGVNRIVLVSHLQGLHQDRETVPQLEGVDVVIAGGGDELLKNEGDTCMPEEEAAAAYPSSIGDIPVVTGPGGYRCIGALTVSFDADGNVTSYEGRAIGVGMDVEPDAEVQAAVIKPLTEALEGLSTNVLATSEVDLDGRRSSVRTMSANEGSLLSDALLYEGQSRAESFGAPVPQVAIQNGGGIRNDAVIPAGEITEADTFDIAPFGNFVVTVEVPRERFKELLENAVSGMPEAEGRFAQPAGFTMDVNPNNPGREINHEGECELTGDEGSRVVNVVLDDGTEIVREGEVVPGDPVNLATIDFLAKGGDCYPLGDLEFTRMGTSYQQALANYVTGPLAGNINASDYAQDASRIRLVGGTGGAEAAEAATEEATEEAATEEATEEADESLARTGSETALMLIIGMSVVAGGALVLNESRKY